MKKLKSSLISILKGISIPAIATLIFVIVVGLFMSLTLLVISIEEGTGNLSDSSMSMTWAALLFAQGVGLGFDDFILTVIPLGLTSLIITMLAILMRKLKGGLLVNCIGLFVWVFINGVISQNTNIELLDSLPVILLKSFCVYAFAQLIAVFPYSSLFVLIKNNITKNVPEHILKRIKICLYSTVIVLSIYAIIALSTIIFWSIVGASNVEIVFSKLGMQLGSRILTTIACLVWLPNVALWALSWISGSGFAIGSVANFTIYAVNRKSLPPVPFFAIFPDSIGDSLYRLLVNGIVFALCGVFALFMILYSKSCNIRLHFDKDKLDWKSTVIAFVESAVVLVSTCILVILVMSILFLFANGDLGKYRLSNVGVNVSRSVRALGHLTVFGFGLAWILVIFVCAIIISIRALSSKIFEKYDSIKPSNFNIFSKKLSENISEKSKENQNIKSQSKPVEQSCETSVITPKENNMSEKSADYMSSKKEKTRSSCSISQNETDNISQPRSVKSTKKQPLLENKTDTRKPRTVSSKVNKK